MLAYYLIGVGLTMLAVAAAQLLQRLKLKRRMCVTNGRIIGWRQRRDLLVDRRRSNTFYNYSKIIEFEDAGGRGFVFDSNVGYPLPKCPAGNVVRILYDPSNPAVAYEDSGVAFWGFASGLLLLGILSLISGLSLT